MHKKVDLTLLQDFLDPEDVGWKPIAVSKKTGKALVAAYVTNRAIMDRLDEACGPENWRNEFVSGPNGGLLCGISIRFERADGSAEWVTKWDGAENTDVEPVKGGLSSSMRRAAVQWGIGRYLYRLPSPWIPVDERGGLLAQPSIPSAFLRAKPEVAASGDGAGPASQAAEPVPSGKGEARRKPGAHTKADNDADRYFMPGNRTS